MAVKIKTDNSFARQDTLRVHPDDVATGRDSRVVPAPDQDTLDRKRAVSIIQRGQLQPVAVRRDGEKRLVTVAGNTRHRAVRLILSGFEHDGVTYDADPEARLWVAVEDVTEDEAFDRGVAENRERNNATDLQEALAQNVYRTERGLNNTEIAKKYGYDNTNRVAALEKLLAAPEPVKAANHAGRISLDAALKVAKLPEDKQSEFLDKLAAGETVGGGSVRKADASARRTVKDFKDFVKSAADNSDTTHEELLTRIESWFAGKIGDRALWATLEKYRKES